MQRDLEHITPPKRRPATEMRSFLASIADGAVVEAKFLTVTFGCYSVIGPARWSPTIGGFVIGGAILSTNRVPTGSLVGLTAGTPRSRTPGSGVSVDEIHVGDVVEAKIRSFRDVLTITGAVAGTRESQMLGVGRHILICRRGDAAPTVLKVSVFEEAGGRVRRTLPTPRSWADLDD